MLIYNPIDEAMEAEMDAATAMDRAKLARAANMTVETQRDFLNCYAAYQEALARYMTCVRVANWANEALAA